MNRGGNGQTAQNKGLAAENAGSAILTVVTVNVLKRKDLHEKHPCLLPPQKLGVVTVKQRQIKGLSGCYHCYHQFATCSKRTHFDSGGSSGSSRSCASVFNDLTVTTLRNFGGSKNTPIWRNSNRINGLTVTTQNAEGWQQIRGAGADSLPHFDAPLRARFAWKEDV